MNRQRGEDPHAFDLHLEQRSPNIKCYASYSYECKTINGFVNLGFVNSVSGTGINCYCNTHPLTFKDLNALALQV